MLKTERLNLVLNETENKELIAVADFYGMKKSELVRYLVKQEYRKILEKK